MFCNFLRLDVLLIYLNLLYNDIGDKGVIFLGLVIKVNVVFDMLDVSWNSICV